MNSLNLFSLPPSGATVPPEMAELVGRQVEVKALAASCERAARERKVTAVLVEGPPGIGKTRLLDEGLRVQPIDARVHVAGYEPESDLPFAVGRELIAALIRSSPEASDSLAPVLEETSREDPLAWAAVFEAAYRAVSAGPALVVAVDDFQWSDRQSTALLHYLIRGADAKDIAVAFVIAGRMSKPIGALAPSLQRLLGDRLTRIVLDPLDESSAVELARSANPSIDGAAAQRVAIRSQGSPFWCELLATAGDPEADVGRITDDALVALPQDATSAFVTVALLARPVHVDEISQIHNWAPGRAYAAVGPLAATPLIVRHGDTIQVAHDLARPRGSITRTRSDASFARQPADWSGGMASRRSCNLSTPSPPTIPWRLNCKVKLRCSPASSDNIPSLSRAGTQ